jgi:hypothetical protein
VIPDTNPLARVNEEIKPRTDAVGIFSTRSSVLRLVGMVLAAQDDEWQDGRRFQRGIDGGPGDHGPRGVSPALLTTRSRGARMISHHILALDLGSLVRRMHDSASHTVWHVLHDIAPCTIPAAYWPGIWRLRAWGASTQEESAWHLNSLARRS